MRESDSRVLFMPNLSSEILTISSDHIFYFSYVQPAPKGDVMDLWANADELASVNGRRFSPVPRLFPLFKY